MFRRLYFHFNKRFMEKSIVHDHQPVFYHSTGEGNPVVFLHGLAEDATIWDLQIDFLSGANHILIPDLPGSGRSPLPAAVSMESLAGAVKAVLEAEGVEQAVLIGHSMGGYVMLAFAELYPHMVKALGLFHSTSYADGEEKKAARKRNIEFIGTHGSHAYLKQATPALFSPASKQQHPEKVSSLIEKYKGFNPQSLTAYHEAMLQRPDRSRLLADAAHPVLFIIGKQDGTIPFQQSLEQSHLPRTAYIQVLENSGHMGMLEETDKGNEALKKFLDDVYIA